MPPGTGDVPLTVFQSLPVAGVVVVTSPQELVGMIVDKAVNMADMMHVPVLGIVENMSWFTPASHPDEKYYIFGKDGGKNLAEKLGVTKPSVTYATKQLKQNGFITMDRDGLITLTESGMEIADRIYTRHKTLTEFFIRIGVDEKTAREDACKVEHDLSEKTFTAICEHVAKQKDLQ